MMMTKEKREGRSTNCAVRVLVRELPEQRTATRAEPIFWGDREVFVARFAKGRNRVVDFEVDVGVRGEDGFCEV